MMVFVGLDPSAFRRQVRLEKQKNRKTEKQKNRHTHSLGTVNSDQAGTGIE